MQNTKIEWTDSTWSPLRVRVRKDAAAIAKEKGYSSLVQIAEKMAGHVGPHCEHVSPGCENCYAEGNNHRCLPSNGTGLPYDRRSRDLVESFVDEKILLQPLKWKPVIVPCVEGKQVTYEMAARCRDCTTRPRRIFIENQSDLFGEWYTDEQRDRVFAVMALCHQHIFQILTKRPERMMAYLTHPEMPARVEKHYDKLDPEHATDLALGSACVEFPLINVWLGVTSENQEQANKRIPLLLQTPAAIRFASCEPLLGFINFARIEVIDTPPKPGEETADGYCINALDGTVYDDENGDLSTAPDGEVPIERGLDQIICGGESGPGARPMHPDWARSLRDQCVKSEVSFFFKQWGEWFPTGGVDVYGRVIDGKEVKGRRFPNSEGISMLSDGRICLKDFTSAEHQRRMKEGKAYSTACVRVDEEALKAFDDSLDGPTENPLGYEWMYRVGKKFAGSLLDGQEWKQFPESK